MQFVRSLVVFLFFGVLFSSAKAQLLNCQEEKAQDFLKHEIIKASLIQEEAQKKSIEYRVMNYGHTDSSNVSLNPMPVANSIKETTFLGIKANVHTKIIHALKCVEQSIQLECVTTQYHIQNLSSYRAKNSYRGGEISNHVFGTAIDLDPLINPCCGCVAPWSEHPSCRNLNLTAWDRVQIPHCWIHSFEKYGFYWLGRDFDIQDTMHFEYLGNPSQIQNEKLEKVETACPSDMILIKQGQISFCIDKFEAPNIEGAKPFVARTALEGEKFCQSNGKELCSDVEWEKACKGPDNYPYPYGQTYQEGTCNDDKVWRSPIWALVARYNPLNPDLNIEARDHINYLDQSEASGSRKNCVTGEGVYDLTGNSAEWVRNSKKKPSGVDGKVYDHNIKGCFWSKCYKDNKPSCAFTNSNHAGSFRSYETGFRCCKKGQSQTN